MHQNRSYKPHVSGQSEDRETVNAHKPFRVLIVDDEALIGNVIQNELEIRGHQVVGRAADGRQAVELAQSLRPDIILMDIVMPDMDGLEATRQIQEKCPCPVVLLTAHEDPDLVARAGQVGAGAYLVKPPNGPELARTMALAMARFEDLEELRRLNAELHKVLAEVKTLKGLLPICSYCKSIRDDKGYWHRVDEYIRDHSEADLSHGICPECIKERFPDIAEEI